MKRFLFAGIVGFVAAGLVFFIMYLSESGNSPSAPNADSGTKSPTADKAAILAPSGVNQAVALKENNKTPASRDELREINEGSRGTWVVSESSPGSRRISGGVFPTESNDPLEASQAVLKRFGGLIGLSPEAAALVAVNREPTHSQVVYRQILNGLPVFNSRVNLNFNEKGELVHVQSDVYEGPAPAPRSELPLAAAAAIVRAKLLQYLANEGGPSPEATSYPLPAIEAAGAKGYRLVSGVVEPVYQFHFPLEPPRVGDMEAILGSEDGGVVVFRNLSRK